MDITSFVMKMAIGGSWWILLILVFLSVISLSFIVERYILFKRWERETQKLWMVFSNHLNSQKIDKIREECSKIKSPLMDMVLSGLNNLSSEPNKLQGILEAEKVMLKLFLDKRLAFLGTIGSNAPFIGLFGTVIGIVHAFKVLGTSGQGGTQIMSAIAEALVATALGLFVAIPATIAFNYFKKKESDLLSYAEAINNLIMGEVKK